MSRRKITEINPLKNKGLRGYQAMWGHIRSFKGSAFTVSDIDGAMNAHCKTVCDYIKRLVRAGYVQELSERRDGKKLYCQIKNTVNAPRLDRQGRIVVQGRGREHMWRCIKMIGVFTVKDLAVASTTEEVLVSEATAADYTKFLVRAGYVKTVRAHKQSGLKGVGIKASYRFMPGKNTGPKAPMITRAKQVYDPNLEKVVWPLESDGQS